MLKLFSLYWKLTGVCCVWLPVWNPWAGSGPSPWCSTAAQGSALLERTKAASAKLVSKCGCSRLMCVLVGIPLVPIPSQSKYFLYVVYEVKITLQRVLCFTNDTWGTCPLCAVSPSAALSCPLQHCLQPTGWRSCWYLSSEHALKNILQHFLLIETWSCLTFEYAAWPKMAIPLQCYWANTHCPFPFASCFTSSAP